MRVEVVSEEGLPTAVSEFTSTVFAALGKPCVDLHPRALLRCVVDGRRRKICPSSWPTPPWARLIIEQISFDTSGMQPRLLYNDLPWLEQPAIYTDCYMVVVNAKRVVDEWVKEKKERQE